MHSKYLSLKSADHRHQPAFGGRALRLGAPDLRCRRDIPLRCAQRRGEAPAGTRTSTPERVRSDAGTGPVTIGASVWRGRT